MNKNIARRKRSNEEYRKKQQELIESLGEEERLDFEKHQKILFSKDDKIDGETWHQLKGWEDYYVISNYGRIRRLKNGRGRWPHLHHSCYYTTSLHNGNKSKYFILSRLLAINFIDNPNNCTEVNHKNKIRIDCRISNLEWASSKDNTKHKISVSCSHDSRKKIVQISMSGKFIKEWDSISSAAGSLGKKGANIVIVCQNKNDYAYGYIWMYKDDYELNGIKNRHIQKKYRKCE